MAAARRDESGSSIRSVAMLSASKLTLVWVCGLRVGAEAIGVS